MVMMHSATTGCTPADTQGDAMIHIGVMHLHTVGVRTHNTLDTHRMMHLHTVGVRTHTQWTHRVMHLHTVGVRTHNSVL